MKYRIRSLFIALFVILCIIFGAVSTISTYTIGKMWPLPSLPSYTGPYTVGTFDIEVPSADLISATSTTDLVPETVACRVFYPAENIRSYSARPVYWIQDPQKGIVAAYGKFLGARPALANAFTYLSSVLYYIRIPATRNAKLLHPPTPSGRWPVMIFSHGLGGTRNTYSHICGTLASYGIVVYSMDHRDGSSPIQYIRATDKTPAREAEYKSYSHAPSPEVYAGRDEQLKIRLFEVSLMHELLMRKDRGETLNNLDPNHSKNKVFATANSKASDKGLLSMFAGKLDVHTPGKISFGGHSMGGATMIQFVKSAFYTQTQPSLLVIPPSDALKAQITPNTPVILLDPWGLPLVSPSTSALRKQPMPCFDASAPTSSSSPVLAILSSAFYNWKGNYNQVDAALATPSSSEKSRHAPAHIFYPVNSAHLGQSDFGVLFPNITKYFAHAPEPERTLRLNARAILEVLRRQNISVADTTVADLELTGEQQKDEKDRGDWRILSTQEDSVRGWVSLTAEEVGSKKTNDMERKREVPNSPEMNKVKYEAEFAADGILGDSLGEDELATSNQAGR